jgi:Flp pilus assembly pilin Flp
MQMSALRNSFKRFLSDDTGGEIIEYALVLGLIIVAAIALVAAFGVKVTAKWSSVNNSM